MQVENSWKMDKNRNVNVQIPKNIPNPFVRLKTSDIVKNSKQQDSPILLPQKQLMGKSTTPNENDKSKECANCLDAFEGKIRKVFAISDKDVNGKDIPIPNKKALAFIFESTGKENVHLKNSKFLTEPGQILLCLKCAQFLHKLFKAFKDFSMVGNANSMITQKLKQLRKYNASTEGEDTEYNISSDIDIDIKEEPDDIIEECDSEVIKTEPEINTDENPEKNFNFFNDIVKPLKVPHYFNRQEKGRPRMSTRSTTNSKCGAASVKRKPGFNCSHCCTPFSDGKRKISAISVKGENAKDTPVPIKAALGFIFESIGSSERFKRKVAVFLTTPSNSQLYFLCLECALSLGKLYKTFQQFSDREAVNSEISHKVKLLRVYKYIHVNLLRTNKISGTNCSNCAVKFNTKNKKISAISVSEENGKNTTIPIKNALACVLESEEKNKNLSLFLNDSRNTEFFLCLDCALSLGDLYKAFMHFDGLGVGDGEISRQLRTLRMMNYRNTISKLVMKTIEVEHPTHPSSSQQPSSWKDKAEENKRTDDPQRDSTTATNTEVNKKKSTAPTLDEGKKSEDSECTTDDETYKSEKRTKFIPLKDNSHRCVLCDKVYSRKSWLLSHILVRHTEKTTFQCSVCQKRFNSDNKLKIHMYLHNKSEKPPFSCEPCNQHFLTERCLKNHISRLHRVERKCCICQKVFYLKASIRKHLKKCKIEKFDSTCHICKTEFPSITDTISHLETHSGQGPWQCKDCNKSFNMPTNYQEHAKTHFSDGEKGHFCSICGIKVKSLHSLKYHEELHDDNIPRPFLCPHENCNLTFKKECHLKRHQRLHVLKTQGKSFQCTIDNCGKLFLTASNLQSHIRVHSDLKINVCDYCGKTFNFPANMRTHIKNMHSKNASSSN